MYGVGGYGRFWNEHHRKRVKAVHAILAELTRRDPHLPDVEFVVNFHDYNKLMRRPNDTLAWGDPAHRPPYAEPRLKHPPGAGGAACAPPPEEREEGGEEAAADGMGGGGRAGSFAEHAPLYPGHDWALHYRIHGNHFGNAPHPGGAGGAPDTALFSATSCAFSLDVSFPTTFYDFEGWDAELAALHNASEELYPWDAKLESAYFRGSCWSSAPRPARRRRRAGSASGTGARRPWVLGHCALDL